MAIHLLKHKTAESGISVFRETEEGEQMAKLLYTLLFGFFAGILGMILKKESLLYNTGFLDSYTLGPVKYLQPDTGKLLVTIFMQRLGAAVLLIILATTYLGSVTAYLYQFWSGLAIGILSAGSVLRYGAKGILLAAGSLFPQQLILIPAFLILSAKCSGLCRTMYFQGGSGRVSGGEKAGFILRRALNMITCVMIIAAGCFLEAYINPRILKAILQLF